MSPFDVICMAVVFTNGISCVTNYALSTNKDEIVGSPNSFSMTNNPTPVKDMNDNVVSLVTNAGIYKLTSPLGWGYQQQLQIPTNQTVFLTYAPTSLSYHLITNLQARTNGFSDPSSAERMFSTQNWSTTNFIPNTGFWLSFAPQKTAIVVARGSPLTGSIGGSAVSKRHILSCAHSSYATNEALFFVDDNGSLVERTVIGRTLNVAGTDVAVFLLNSNLPDTIHPFSVLPTSYTNQMPLLVTKIQLVGCNQAKQMFPKLATNFFGSCITNAGNGVVGWSGEQDTNPLWLGTNWNVMVITGDSGHPIMMLVGTNLVMVSHWTYVNSGCNYAYYESSINSAMHFLSTNCNAGSDYQLSTFDLSAFPTY